MIRKRGAVTPNGVVLERHEQEIVVAFTNLGYNVELIPLSYCKGKKTADAIINGVEWEFKTPHTPTTRALDHLLRKATKQSHNIVIDLRHFSPSIQSSSIKKLEFLSRQLKSLRKLKVLTGSVSKTGKILDIIK